MKIFGIALILLMTSLFMAHAKRGEPQKVPPIEYNDLVISASRDPESMGYIFAKDKTTGEVVWRKRIYSIFIWPLLEEDVQWVFISKMTLNNDLLIIENERNERFSFNLKSRSLKRIRSGADALNETSS